MNIEPLEPRIVPASTLAYTDVDGDLVRITSSVGDLNAAGVATFDVPSGRQQLQLLNLNDPSFEGTNITTVVTRRDGGDGFVDIGRIRAMGNDLGKLVIKGDLGSLIAGDGDASTGPGLKLLNVRSMGLRGVATQAPGGDLSGVIEGAIGSIVIAGDLISSFGARGLSNQADGSIGSVVIGGSIIGSASFGSLFSTGDMRSVTIGRDIVGGVEGSSGGVSCVGRLSSLTLKGSLIGGTAFFDGSITAGSIGTVTVGGNLLGGGGAATGAIFSRGTVDRVAIAGSVIGGGENQVFISNGTTFAGQVLAGSDIGAVTIGRDLVGTEGVGTAGVQSLTLIGSVRVGGSVIGGPGERSAQVTAGARIGSVFVGEDVIGGDGNSSGRFVTPGSIGPVTIGRAMAGGDGNDSGNVVATGDIGPVSIRGSVIGGKGTSSGQIVANDVLASVTIGGSLIGGAGVFSGTINGGAFDGSAGDTFGLGPVKIGRHLVGGTGNDSARIAAGGDCESVTIGGSIIGQGPGSGQIFAAGDLGPVKLGGDLVGGSIGEDDPSLAFTGYIQGDRIASVFIGGSIRAGLDASEVGSLSFNASIRAFDDIGPIVVQGSITGSVHDDATAADGAVTLVVISARGQESLSGGATTDTAIKSLTVGGRVAFTNVLAGYDTLLAPQNGNASVGPVTVARDWSASNLVAGVRNLGADDLVGGTGANADDVNFGDQHDRRIGSPTLVARIASITIRGAVVGTAASGDHFGFVAPQIGAFRGAGFIAPLTAADDNAIQVPIVTRDVTVQEV